MKFLTPLVSTIATGTAPITTASTTAATNLNADLLDGQHASYYTNIAARLGYTPLNKAGDTCEGSLYVNNYFGLNTYKVFRMFSLGVERSAWNPLYGILNGAKALYKDEDFATGLNGLQLYDLGGGTYTSLTQLTGQTNIPNSTGNIVRFAYNGLGTPSSNPSPGMGGFVFGYDTSTSKNHVLMLRFRAKAPVGVTFNMASNATGDDTTRYWMTNNVGTGKWEEYVAYIQVGSTGSFSTTGHTFITSASNVATTVDIASAGMYDMDVPSSSIYVPLAGGTMTGTLVINRYFPAMTIKCADSTTWTGLDIRNDLDQNYRSMRVGYFGSTSTLYGFSSGTQGEQGIIGTTGAYPLSIGTNNYERIVISSAGVVTIKNQVNISNGFGILADSSILMGSDGTLSGASTPSGLTFASIGAGTGFGITYSTLLGFKHSQNRQVQLNISASSPANGVFIRGYYNAWTSWFSMLLGSGANNSVPRFTATYQLAAGSITDTGSAITLGVATSVTGSLTISSGVIKAPDGTVTAPSHTFSGLTTLGMFRSSNTLGFTAPTSGAFKFYINSVEYATMDATNGLLVDGDHVLTESNYGTYLPAYEPALGNPAVSGYVLSSTAAGVRSWVVNGSGSSLAVHAFTDATYHTGVSVSSPSSGQFLKYNGTNWVNSAHGLTYTDVGAASSSHTHTALADISNAALGNSAANGYLLSINGSGVRTWIANAGGMTAHDLLGAYHNNTTVTGTVTSGQFLKYNGTNWTNSAHGLTYTDVGAASSGHNHNSTYEALLGNPAADGYVLSSTSTGTRSWITKASCLTQHGFADSTYHSGIAISNVSPGQVLAYDGANWSNHTVVASDFGAAATSHTHSVYNDLTTAAVGNGTATAGYALTIVNSVRTWTNLANNHVHVTPASIDSAALGTNVNNNRVLAINSSGVRTWVENTVTEDLTGQDGPCIKISHPSLPSYFVPFNTGDYESETVVPLPPHCIVVTDSELLRVATGINVIKDSLQNITNVTLTYTNLYFVDGYRVAAFPPA